MIPTPDPSSSRHSPGDLRLAVSKNNSSSNKQPSESDQKHLLSYTHTKSLFNKSTRTGMEAAKTDVTVLKTTTSSTTASKRSKSSSCPSSKSAYKHIPHREKPPHLVAKRNARERRRVQAVNSAFVQLRKCVPFENRNKRLSKVKTLQKAIEYIENLTDTLRSLDPGYAIDDRSGSSLSLEESSSCITDLDAVSSTAEMTPRIDPLADYESESRAQEDDLLVLLEHEYNNSVGSNGSSSTGRSGGGNIVNNNNSQQASCYPGSHQLAATVSTTSLVQDETAAAAAAVVVAYQQQQHQQHQHPPHEQVYTHQHAQQLHHHHQQQHHHHYFHNYLSHPHYHPIS